MWPAGGELNRIMSTNHKRLTILLPPEESFGSPSLPDVISTHLSPGYRVYFSYDSPAKLPAGYHGNMMCLQGLVAMLRIVMLKNIV